jgi:hypothetical protein
MGNFKVCPKCKTENPMVASFCRHCRYVFPEETKNGQVVTPKIVSFILIEDVYTIGSIIHFDWVTENATSAQLNGQEVDLIGHFDFKVDKAESITLTVENDYDKAAKTIRLVPRPQPSIRNFSAAQSNIRSGQDIKLKWEAKNCHRISLVWSEGSIDVTNKTYCKVPLLQSETFTITGYAEDENVFVEQNFRVNVIAPVRINKFVTDKSVVVEGDKVILSWDVENASSITLMPLMKDVTKMSYYEINPSRTSEYVLVARNNLSQEEVPLSVGVRQLPKLDLKFADALTNIKMPSCNVNLSFLSESLTKARVDEWMTMRPIDDIRFSILKNMFFNKLKGVVKIFKR